MQVQEKDVRGFSLIELVIALGIMGIVLMGTAAMFTAMMRQTHDLEVTNRLTDTIQEFRTNLKSKDFCNPNIAHFSRQTIDTGAVSVTNSATYPQDMTVSKFTNLDGTDYLAPGKELPGLKGSNLKSLALTDIKPITADAKSYSAKLQLAIDKGENSQVANVIRTVSVYFKLGDVPQGNATTFAIESCTSLMSEYSEGDFQVMCKGMGGTWDSSKGACRAPSSYQVGDTVGAWSEVRAKWDMETRTYIQADCPSDIPDCPSGAGYTSTTSMTGVSFGSTNTMCGDSVGCNSTTTSSPGTLCLAIDAKCASERDASGVPTSCMICRPYKPSDTDSEYVPTILPGTQG